MFELLEKKSRFLAYAYNVKSKSDCELILKDLKKEHKKCTHICYAYKIVGEEFLVKCSDDGEPSGTAGRPILNVIEKKNLTNVLCVVVRYFGGVKLGAGGLVRAYTNAISKELENFGDKNENNRT